MKKTTIKIISLSLLSLAAATALANVNPGKGNDGKGDDRHQCHGDARKCLSAPEIDPAQAMGALVLLSGAVAIMRGRRKK